MTEPAGIRRYKFPVLLQLPHVDARSTQRLRIVDAESGDEIPAQANVARSSDLALAERSIWLQVRFHCSLEPFETRTFMAEWVTAALIPSPPSLELNGMRLTVEESAENAGCFTVRNGDAIRWSVPFFFGSGISSVVVPPTEYVRQQGQQSDASALRLTYRLVCQLKSFKWTRCY